MYVRWPKQVRSLNGGRHGMLCRCQHQSLLNVGGHYNARLFKLSRPKRQRNFHSSLGVRRTVKSSTAAVVPGVISFVHEHHRSHQLPRYDDACLVSQQVSGQAGAGQDEAHIIVVPLCSQIKGKEVVIASVPRVATDTLLTVPTGHRAWVAYVLPTSS